MPLIGGQGGHYELVARVYDVLKEYTEVVCPIYVSILWDLTEWSEWHVGVSRVALVAL
jgi:hypothetical protein